MKKNLGGLDSSKVMIDLGGPGNIIVAPKHILDSVKSQGWTELYEYMIECVWMNVGAIGTPGKLRSVRGTCECEEIIDFTEHVNNMIEDTWHTELDVPLAGEVYNVCKSCGILNTVVVQRSRMIGCLNARQVIEIADRKGEDYPGKPKPPMEGL